MRSCQMSRYDDDRIPQCSTGVSRGGERGVICHHGEASSSAVRAARVLGDGNSCSVWSRRPRWQARRPGGGTMASDFRQVRQDLFIKVSPEDGLKWDEFELDKALTGGSEAETFRVIIILIPRGHDCDCSPPDLLGCIMYLYGGDEEGVWDWNQASDYGAHFNTRPRAPLLWFHCAIQYFPSYGAGYRSLPYVQVSCHLVRRREGGAGVVPYHSAVGVLCRPYPRPLFFGRSFAGEFHQARRRGSLFERQGQTLPAAHRDRTERTQRTPLRQARHRIGGAPHSTRVEHWSRTLESQPPTTVPTACSTQDRGPKLAVIEGRGALASGEPGQARRRTCEVPSPSGLAAPCCILAVVLKSSAHMSCI